MLTIKRVESSGLETVHEIKSVQFVPRDGASPPALVVEMPDGIICRWDNGGSFAVMNEVGNTIARYWIGEHCQPCHQEMVAA